MMEELLSAAGRALGGIHVGAFGFSSPEYILSPLRVHRPAAFILLENPVDKARARHAAADVNVDEELDALGIPWVVRKCNLWDPAEVAGTLKRIQAPLGESPVYVNVTAGPNTVAVGAALASIYWNVRPYHTTGKQPEQPIESIDGTTLLPVLKAPLPNERQLDTLEAAASFARQVSGAELKRVLRTQYSASYSNERGENLSPAALHNRLTAELDRLTSSGACNVNRSGRKIRVAVTTDGLRLLAMFRPADRTEQARLPRT